MLTVGKSHWKVGCQAAQVTDGVNLSFPSPCYAGLEQDRSDTPSATIPST